MRQWFKIPIFFSVFSLTSCEDARPYKRLLQMELDETTEILESEMEQQNAFISGKTDDFPNLLPLKDSLDKNKTMFAQRFDAVKKQKDTALIRQILNDANSKSPLQQNFHSLDVKYRIDDSLFLAIVKADKLRLQYQINNDFIDKHGIHIFCGTRSNVEDK